METGPGVNQRYQPPRHLRCPTRDPCVVVCTCRVAVTYTNSDMRQQLRPVVLLSVLLRSSRPKSCSESTMQSDLQSSEPSGSDSAPAAEDLMVARCAAKPSPDHGVYRVRLAYENTDPEVREELEDIEDMLYGRSKALCRLLHRLACSTGHDRYQDPVSGLEVFTSEALKRQPCCGAGCRHCPHGHKNVPKRKPKGQQKGAEKIRPSPSCCSSGRPDEHSACALQDGELEAAGDGCCSRKEGSCGASSENIKTEGRLSESDASEGSSDEGSSSDENASEEAASSERASQESAASESESDEDGDGRTPVQRGPPQPFTSSDLSSTARAELKAARGTRMGAERLLHREACRGGHDTYTDPRTGNVVFTARCLERRPCCGNGCRHCPHNHSAVPEYMREAHRATALLDDCWDW